MWGIYNLSNLLHKNHLPFPLDHDTAQKNGMYKPERELHRVLNAIHHWLHTLNVCIAEP